MNFLQLCQKAARDSGTVQGLNQPSSVAGQTGRLGKVVYWTAEAYCRIQTERGGLWRWLRADFSGEVTAGTKRYTPASWNLDRHASWLEDAASEGYRPMTLYRTADGASDESELVQISYEEWKRRYDRGLHDAGRPVEWAIAPTGDFCLGPTPDAAYALRGEYRKSPQLLAAGDDVPEMPARYHDIIAWRALMLLAEHDEAVAQLQTANLEFGSLFAQLVNRELDAISLGGGALA